MTTPQGSLPAESRHDVLRQLAFRPSRPHLLIGLLFLILGLLGTVAVQQQGTGDVLATARTEDLVRILDDLGEQQTRLSQESQRLAEVRQGLEAGSTVEAAAEAQRRLAALEVLSGTTPVTGPGVRVTLSDAPGSTSAVDASTVLDAVQELRDAGAQAIQVGPVRVGVATWFADSASGVVADGTSVGTPVTIDAVGDPQTLSAALSIPGGLADTVRTRGADFELTSDPAVSISVTVPTTDNQEG